MGFPSGPRTPACDSLHCSPPKLNLTHKIPTLFPQQHFNPSQRWTKCANYKCFVEEEEESFSFWAISTPLKFFLIWKLYCRRDTAWPKGWLNGEHLMEMHWESLLLEFFVHSPLLLLSKGKRKAATDDLVCSFLSCGSTNTSIDRLVDSCFKTPHQSPKYKRCLCRYWKNVMYICLMWWVSKFYRKYITRINSFFFLTCQLHFFKKIGPVLCYSWWNQHQHPVWALVCSPSCSTSDTIPC